MSQTKTATRKIINKKMEMKDEKVKIKKDNTMEEKKLEKRDSGIEMMDNVQDNSILEKEHSELQMAYKDLMEKYIKIKQEKSETVSTIMNHNILNMIRSDLKVADSWLKALSKDNLSMYMENSNFILIEPEPEYMVVKNMENSSLSALGMTYNCNCSICIGMKIDIFDKFKARKVISHKKFVITRNVDFEISFNNEEFMYHNEVSSDGVKQLRLKHKEDDKKNVLLKFEVKKEKKLMDTTYNFGQMKIFTFPWKNEMYSISILSIIVSVSMRSMRNSKMVGMLTGKLDTTSFNSNCFKILINTLMEREFLDCDIFSWHQLSMEEEAILLTNLGEMEVYIYLHNGEMCNALNHISKENFSKSHKIKIKELSYPMSRFWYFFSDEEILDIEGVMISGHDHNSEDEREEADSIEDMPDQFFPNPQRWENQFVNKEDNEYFKVLKNFQGGMDTDFAKSVMMEKMSNKGYSNSQLMLMLDTKLANVMWKSENYDPGLLMLFSMSMRQFQVILYFSGSKKDIPNMVLNLPVSTWIQMWGTMPRMFNERFKSEFNLNKENFKDKLNEFMDIVSEISDLNSLFVNMMFKQFKMRIFQIITMRMMGAEDDNRDIMDRHNNWVSMNSMEDRLKRAIYFGRYHVKDDIQQNDKCHIRRYQADSSTNEFLKSFQWIEDFNMNLLKENSWKDSDLMESMFDSMMNI